ncbi:hypothetical protein SteCoe_36983 [Stentor coeruleus]|uniref:Protein kinase domain-containing protein n=1 Tax=Stentor coeruleus TaxID=5963 RepID=A0A1R2AP15_9CILI|nr:hypothetical protein SteCoe_36983 [Stentor coeruleus]
MEIKKFPYRKHFISDINNKIIVPLFQCSKAFPGIYGVKKHLGKETKHITYKCFEKGIKSSMPIMFDFLLIYKEIKYYRQLSKINNISPQIFYFSSRKDKKIMIGTEHCGLNLKDFMLQNPDLSSRDMKLLFYNVIKAFHTLKENNIVHNDIKPHNILIKSSEEVKIIDYENSFRITKTYKDSDFPLYWLSKIATKQYISPELMTIRSIKNTEGYIRYDPLKSDVFSLGLCFLDIFGIEIYNLNYFGSNYDIHIMEMLTISYDYIIGDSLRNLSYKLLREELQNRINNKIQENLYDYLNDTIRRMLEVDMVERVTMDEVYKDAKFHVGIFN